MFVSTQTHTHTHTLRYVGKYEEEFMPFFPKFAEDVWNQLKRCTKAVRHDKLVTASMQFLSSVVKRNMHRKVFESEQALLSMIRDVVVPNIMFREHDEEMLEDNPLEYIRLDIEGSDSSTRRRSACDLVRALCVQFNDQIAPICVNFIDQMMAQYVSLFVSNTRKN